MTFSVPVGWGGPTALFFRRSAIPAGCVRWLAFSVVPETLAACSFRQSISWPTFPKVPPKTRIGRAPRQCNWPTRCARQAAVAGRVLPLFTYGSPRVRRGAPRKDRDGHEARGQAAKGLRILACRHVAVQSRPLVQQVAWQAGSAAHDLPAGLQCERLPCSQRHSFCTRTQWDAVAASDRRWADVLLDVVRPPNKLSHGPELCAMAG